MIALDCFFVDKDALIIFHKKIYDYIRLLV